MEGGEGNGVPSMYREYVEEEFVCVTLFEWKKPKGTAETHSLSWLHNNTQSERGGQGPTPGSSTSNVLCLLKARHLSLSCIPPPHPPKQPAHSSRGECGISPPLRWTCKKGVQQPLTLFEWLHTAWCWVVCAGGADVRGEGGLGAAAAHVVAVQGQRTGRGGHVGQHAQQVCLW